MKPASPIICINDLLLWQADSEAQSNLVPLKTRSVLLNDKGVWLKPHNHSPKVIYCHDMAGNYLESDRHLGLTSVFPAFRFTRWHLIDVFVYFSHHSITVPPISWINLAHRQGVRVYGTLIFESKGNEFFSSVFVNAECSSLNVTTFAENLDRVRRESGFEGWLLNFEVEISEDIVHSRVAQFIKTLVSLGSEVVWYDAVTWSGQLRYQNGLTEHNKPFLSLAPQGLFTNYCWTPDHLKRTQQLADSASDSSRVFVGVDCFGRGCPGGGGWSTSEALQLILDAMTANPDRPLSVALFAPGWPFEKCDLSRCQDNPVAAHNLIADDDEKFWTVLEKLIGRIRAVPYGCSEVHYPMVLSSHHGSEDAPAFLSTCCTGQGLIGIDRKPASSMGLQQLIPSCRQLWDSPINPTVQSSSTLDSPGRLFSSIQFVCDTPWGTGTCVRFRPSNDRRCEDTYLTELFTFGPGMVITCSKGSVRISIGSVDGSGCASHRECQAFSLILDYHRCRDIKYDVAPSRQYLNHDQVSAESSGDYHWSTLVYRLSSLSDQSSDIEIVRLGLLWRCALLPNGFLLGLVHISNSLK